MELPSTMDLVDHLLSVFFRSFAIITLADIVVMIASTLRSTENITEFRDVGGQSPCLSHVIAVLGLEAYSTTMEGDGVKVVLLQ